MTITLTRNHLQHRAAHAGSGPGRRTIYKLPAKGTTMTAVPLHSSGLHLQVAASSRSPASTSSDRKHAPLWSHRILGAMVFLRPVLPPLPRNSRRNPQGVFTLKAQIGNSWPALGSFDSHWHPEASASRFQRHARPPNGDPRLEAFLVQFSGRHTQRGAWPFLVIASVFATDRHDRMGALGAKSGLPRTWS